eukprot:3778750-Rhodomonas_salina.1
MSAPVVPYAVWRWAADILVRAWRWARGVPTGARDGSQRKRLQTPNDFAGAGGSQFSLKLILIAYDVLCGAWLSVKPQAHTGQSPATTSTPRTR